MKSLHTDEEIEFVFLYRRALNEKKVTPDTWGWSGDITPDSCKLSINQEIENMKKTQNKTESAIITPASPVIPQVPGEGKNSYFSGLQRFSPDTPSFFKLKRKSGYI